MRDISNNFKTALSTSQKRSTRITAQPPGEAAIPLSFISGSVSADIGRNARYQANLQLSPKLGQDLFTAISAPGTVFDIDHGIDFGSTIEYVDVFCGEIVSGSSDIFTGTINISLADMWTKVDRCVFLEPYVPLLGTSRGQMAAQVILEAVPGTVVKILDDGGTLNTEVVYKSSRTEFIDAIRKDGGLDVAFEPNGNLRIRSKPTLSPESASVWVFQSGPQSNLKTIERTRPFDKLYNTVIVKPKGLNFFDEQQVSVEDPTHPRHASKIGTVPFIYESPTAEDEAGALQIAENKLRDILGLTETASLGALSNPALEPGDVVSIVHLPTASDPGYIATHFIDSWDLDLVSGDMNLNTRSSTTEIEEQD